MQTLLLRTINKFDLAGGKFSNFISVFLQLVSLISKASCACTHIMKGEGDFRPFGCPVE